MFFIAFLILSLESLREISLFGAVCTWSALLFISGLFVLYITSGTPGEKASHSNHLCPKGVFFSSYTGYIHYPFLVNSVQALLSASEITIAWPSWLISSTMAPIGLYCLLAQI